MQYTGREGWRFVIQQWLWPAAEVKQHHHIYIEGWADRLNQAGVLDSPASWGKAIAWEGGFA
jgi:hypothetical protein